MTRRSALAAASKRLMLSEASDAQLDALLMLAHVCGIGRVSLSVSLDEPMTAEECARYEAFVQLRESGMPLQYVLSEAYFMGHTFFVDARVLIPRWDTELLCEAAIARIGASAVRVLDIGTGSGALAISISLACPNAEVFALDYSADALRVAERNAQALGARVHLIQSDLYASLAEERFHVIVSNPPYIPTGVLPSLQKEVQKEPMLALDGGTDGLSFYRRIIAELPQHLLPGGSLLLETGTGQASAVAARLEGLFQFITIERDLNHLERAVIGDQYAG